MLTARSHRLCVRGLPDPIRDHAQLAGAALLEALTHDLTRSARLHAEVCLSVSEVQVMLDELDCEEPALVRKLPSLGITPHLLTQILRRLVRESVNIHFLGEILEALAAQSSSTPLAADEAVLTDRVRVALARRISHGLAPAGALHVLRLDPTIEETLLDALAREGSEEWLALPPRLAREIEQAIVSAALATPEPRALITTAALRRHVYQLLGHTQPELSVLSALELAPDLRLTSSRVISP
jgi:flagellar biosynthesis protein FlhA